MSTNTEQLRRNIEQTRAELGEDVDALAEKVTPSKIMDRQSRKVRNAFGTAKEKVMGVVSDTQDAVGDLAQTSGELPRNAVQSAKGNPLAVGLIAFGAAWLVSSLIPASSKERQLTASAKDAAAPLMTTVTEAAKDVADNLRDPAQEAIASVKETAAESATNVREEVGSAAGRVKGSRSSRGKGTRASDASI